MIAIRTTDPFRQGIAAFKSKQSVDSNPYPMPSRNHKEWALGYVSEEHMQKILVDLLGREGAVAFGCNE